jgi:cytochrome c biogenesis protein CcmG, thiol:disulfide interchange protein DsbE
MSSELLEDGIKDNTVVAPATGRRIAILLIPLLLLLALGVLLALNLGKDPKLVPSPFIGKPAPLFSTVDLLSGEKIGTETLRGQAYILNVWASWCVVCQIEHRHFNAYAKTPNALPVIGLNYKDAPEDAKRWLAQLGNPYRQIAVDPDGKIGLDFGVYGAPETYFIDRQGIVRFKQIGVITPAILATQTKLIGGEP